MRTSRPLSHAALLAPLLLSAMATAQRPTWPTTSLCGRIVSVTHEAVPAAEVWVVDAATGERVGHSFADGDGYYLIGNLPTGALRVHARAEGKADGWMSVATEGSVRAATLALEDGAPLELVFGWPDGTPVAEADLIAWTPQDLGEPFQWWTELATDENGVARLASAPLRDLVVRIHRPGFVLHEAAIERSDGDRVAITVPATRAERCTVQVTGIPAGTTTALVCHDDTGYRKSDVPRLPRSARRIAVDPDGTASLWTLPVHHEVRVVAAGQRAMPICVPCKAGQARKITFALSPIPAELATPSTTVTGRVVDTLGRPVPRIAVAARCDDRRGTPTLTDADGRFELDVPAREKVLFDVCVLSPGHHIATPGYKVDTSGLSWLRQPVDPERPLRLDVAPTGAARGTLRRPDGRAFSCARVALDHGIVVSATDPAGRLFVAGIPPGEYSIDVTGSDGMRATGTVTVPEHGVGEPDTLHCIPMGMVSGKVTGPDDKPVAGMPLRIASLIDPFGGNPLRPRPTPTARLVLTDRNGRFLCPNLEEGGWYVLPPFANLGTVRIRPGNMPNEFEAAADTPAVLDIAVDG